MAPTLGNPIGKDGQFLFGFKRVIGAQVDAEIVRPVHPLVHGEAQGHGSFLARLDGRRTDDCAGWSAAFDQFNLWLAQDL